MEFHFIKLPQCALTMVIFAAPLAGVQKKPCSQKEAMSADRAVDSLNTWSEVHRFYNRFSICDDASIAEGVSDKVAKLIANRWESAGELTEFTIRDKEFQSFVIRHIDEMIDWSHDAPKINENAREHCPPTSEELCKALIKRTTPNRN